MKLQINKRIVKAGDIIDVEWDSEEGNSPRLILKSGNNSTSLSVPLSGSKRFKMKGVKGSHSITLIADVYGKEKSVKKRIFVYGQKKETDDFEYIDRGDASSINRWNNSIQQWWQSFSHEKKTLYKLLLMLLAYNALSTIPAAADFALILFYGILFWLFWQVIKK